MSSCREVVVLHIVFTSSTELKSTRYVYIYIFFSMYRKGSNIITIKIHFSCEIEYFVKTHLCKLCVIHSDRAYYGLCVRIKDIGRRLPLQLQCSYQGQQGDVIYTTTVMHGAAPDLGALGTYQSVTHLTLAKKLGITLSWFWYHS